MDTTHALPMALAGLLALWPLPVPIRPQEQPPIVQIPDPGVPETVRLEGHYVRSAYNEEGYAILGYRLANASVGDDWMLLEMGVTLRESTREFTMTREALSLVTPDGTRVPLASVEEFRKASLQALDARADVIRDSIRYFPRHATQACWIGFFSDQASRTLSWDALVLSSSRACIGRVYFRVPGGIKYGQHWLDVQFEKSIVRVPFRILTRDEDKVLSKHFKAIKAQIEEAFKRRAR